MIIAGYHHPHSQMCLKLTIEGRFCGVFFFFLGGGGGEVFLLLMFNLI